MAPLKIALIVLAGVLALLSGCARPQLANMTLTEWYDETTLEAEEDAPPLRLHLRARAVGIDADDSDVRRLSAQVAAYMRKSLRDDVFAEADPTAPPDATVDLTLHTRVQTRRTVILDALFVYPGLFFLPIPHPEWGQVDVMLDMQVRWGDGSVHRISTRARQDYSETLYAWYRTRPLEEAHDRACTAALRQAVRKLRTHLAARTLERPPPQRVAPAPRPTPPAPAQRGPARKLAVLEFVDTAALTPHEAAYVTDLVREGALGLPRGRFLVMTRENILALLPNGADLAACVGGCEVETGRNIGADYVVSGRIIRFGGELRVAMKLHETRSAGLVSSGHAAAREVAGLEGSVEDAARRLFEPLRP